MRVLWFTDTKEGFNFENSLYCSSVLKFGIKDISNEELLRFWKMEYIC